MANVDIEPGVYKGQVTDWSVEEVEALDNKLKLVITLELDNGAKVYWNDFFHKKDGSINKKTINTIETLGFQGKIQDIMKPNALNTSKLYDVTIEKDDKGYTKVAWINDPDVPRSVSRPLDEKVAVRKLAGLNISVGATKTKVKNYAEEAMQKVKDDDLNF